MSEIDNIFIKVRSCLREKSIKLWEEPYYYEGIGSIEQEIEQLSKVLSRELGIAESKCQCAITELQDHALRKLAARKEFDETGEATFNVRCISGTQGTTNIVEVKCDLNRFGEDLQEIIATKLNVSNAKHLKCIAAGKIVASKRTLESQGLKNNQQLLVIIGSNDEVDPNTPSTSSASCRTNRVALYERIHNIKKDVEAIVAASTSLLEIEDQDGNAVFMPPEENRCLVMAMSYCEKARAAMMKEQYDEALLLLLEADENFNSCNSKLLEVVDNYGLLNLDIVWCYLCLKNLSQLPDAQRRLDVCERSFRRSYGEKYDRLIALKGTSCPERALIMRLHLLQGILLFHQNRRDEAYERFELAGNELHDLKVTDTQLSTLVSMGYETSEARLALRACSGNLDAAVGFIHERREKLETARENSEKERKLHYDMTIRQQQGPDWVNPRSVCYLMDMGFERDLVVEALRRAKNDLPKALTLIQTNAAELLQTVVPVPPADEKLLAELMKLGFEENMVRVALETMNNNIGLALDFLVKCFDENKLEEMMSRLCVMAGSGRSMPSSASTSSVASVSQSSQQLPNSSSSAVSLIRRAIEKMRTEAASYKAFKRFNKDLIDNDVAYLDLPLVEEEKLLNEYKKLLEH